MVACPLLPCMTSSTAVHCSSSLLADQKGATSNQLQGVGYSESEVETDAATLELETDMTTSSEVVC
jgi:hypothetical protein